jgi:hypothetical protein
MKLAVIVNKFCFAFTLLLASTQAAHAQDMIHFGGATFNIRYRAGGNLTYVKAATDGIINSDPVYATYPLRMELWLGTKCFSPKLKNQKVYVLAAKNLGYSLNPGEVAYNLSITNSKRMRVATGKRRVTLAIVDTARKGVYGSICFPKAITIK